MTDPDLTAKVAKMQDEVNSIKVVIPGLVTALETLYRLAVGLCRTEDDVQKVMDWGARYAPAMVGKETKQ